MTIAEPSSPTKLAPFNLCPVLIIEEHHEIDKDWFDYLATSNCCLVCDTSQDGKFSKLVERCNQELGARGWDNEKLKNLVIVKMWPDLYFKGIESLNDRRYACLDYLGFTFINNKQQPFYKQKITHFSWNFLPFSAISDAKFLQEFAKDSYKNKEKILLFKKKMNKITESGLAYAYGFNYLSRELLSVKEETEYVKFTCQPVLS
jgi:hypothetical protein